MTISVTAVWEVLQRESTHAPQSARLYRALGDSAIGVRAGYLPQSGILELLIEVPSDWSGESVVPTWRGMGYEIVALGLPPRKTAQHLRLYLVGPEHRDVFVLVCEDLVETLEGITDAATRVRQIEICLARWRSFFEKGGLQGLTVNMQQGLFAELTWLQHLLESKIDPVRAVTSWKGCERAYHDFDLSGHVLEVKCTRTKEPRSVVISNERQFDNGGLKSLHLYVLGVHEIDDGGIALPGLVESIQTLLTGAAEALIRYRSGLVSSGYIDRDAKHYSQQLIIKYENLYEIVEGFPRIINVPPGIGDLKYRLLLGACEPYRTDMDEYLSKLMEL